MRDNRKTSDAMLHVDMDAFFASVEQNDNPELKGKPVVVGAAPDRRGVVSAASYEARKYGIHSAMPSREAGRLCPHAVFRPVNGRRYREVSERVFDIFERFTPLVEPLSIDEAFLNVTGARNLFGDGRNIACLIKETIRSETGLTASVGVAANKFLAKLASDLDKPDGLVVAPERPEEIREFLAPLPVGRIWGVGKVTCRHLKERGIQTIGDIQKMPEEQLVNIAGRSFARHIKLLAHGVDDRELELDREEQSISREHTFAEDCNDVEKIESVLRELAEDVARQLREAEKRASVAHLKLRWKNFRTITRQKPFGRAACDDHTLREMATGLFRREELKAPVRLIGFGVGKLCRSAERMSQLELFSEDSTLIQEKRENLSRAIDEIRSKFGDTSIGSPKSP
ncbi:MAG: DNA polymerase IV [Verrucomicrobiota bacterium]